MDTDKKLELIKRNCVEILGENDLKKLLDKKKKPIVYWGTAITGPPHVAYFLPILKLADFLRVGFKVKVLLADLHGALDNCPWEELEDRYGYYERAIPLIFKAVGVNIRNLEIIRGSKFQLKPEYIYDVLKMSSFASINDCKRAASEVVKFGDNPRLSGLIYPIMQAVDEVYLEADIQYAGTDQRKIMVFARENLPKIGYPSRIEIMTPMIPGLIGKKMSASDKKSKIDLLEEENIIKDKLKNAEMVEGDPNNGVMAFLKNVLMVIKEDKKERFVIKRDKKFGGDIKYSNYPDLEKDFVDKKIHPLDLKNSVAKEIYTLLKKIQKDKKIHKLKKKAYN